MSLTNTAHFYLRTPHNATWERELGWNLNKIGDIKTRLANTRLSHGENPRDIDDFAQALEDFSGSLCVRRTLSNGAPHDMLLLRDVSYTLDRLGDVKATLEDVAGAEAALFESLAIRRRLLQSNPDDLRYAYDLAATLQKLANLYRASDDKLLALALYEAAIEVRAKLKQATRDDKEMHSLEQAAASLRRQIADDPSDIGSSGAISMQDLRSKVDERETLFAQRRQATTYDTQGCWRSVADLAERAVASEATASAR